MTTQTHTRQCRRCHGSGNEPPGPSYTAEQEATLDVLGELGIERADLQGRRAYMTTDGRKRLNEIYAQVRVIADKQRSVQDRLKDLNTERKKITDRKSSPTAKAQLRLDEILARIQMLEADAHALRRIDMQDALGLSSAAFYNILTGKTGN